MRLLPLLILLISTSVWGGPHVEATVQYINYKNVPYLAVILNNDDAWHTYWKNPGDAGTESSFEFILNGQVVTPTPLEWPTPKRFIEKGDMWAYGYEGRYAFFFQIDESFLADGNEITIKAKWLACHDICIPGMKDILGRFQGDELQLYDERPFEVADNQLTRWLETLPQKMPMPLMLDISLAKERDQKHLWLLVNLDYTGEIDTSQNVIYPFPHELLTIYHEELFRDRKGNLYARFKIEWEGEYAEPPLDLPQNGRFEEPLKMKFLFNHPVEKITIFIERNFQMIMAKDVDTFFRFLTPVDLTKKVAVEKTSQESSTTTLLYYLLLAFIGGIILNFMPCVLPVISLKLFGLIKQQELNRLGIIKHNLAYTFGILLTFLIMAATIIGVKSTGVSLGWGFQLQSPTFILVMILVIFIFALNMFGLFEFATPGGKVLGDVKVKQGLLGDVWSGILATILATPCSAPFLGTALAFALSSNASTIVLSFIFIGLGLAFPFILTALFPALISFLPKPGNWMNTLKYFLGLALVLTVVWLLDIYFSLLESTSALMKVNALMALVFFILFLFKKVNLSKKIKGLLLLVTILFAAMIIWDHNKSATTAYDLQWNPWSKEAMHEHKSKRDLVFMDFTANWCLTCKVNKKMVLDTTRFRELVDEYDIKLLRGDITKRDPIIEGWLKEQGMGGVPAYFVINSNGELIKLGETISISEIKESLD